MKKISKASQLKLVRNVVRQLTPTDLGGVAGGLKVVGGDTDQTKGGCLSCTVTCPSHSAPQ